MQVCQKMDERGADSLWASGGLAVSEHIGMLEAQNMQLHQRAQLLEHILARALKEQDETLLCRGAEAPSASAWPQLPMLLGRHSLLADSKPSSDFRPPPGLAPPSPKFVKADGMALVGIDDVGLEDHTSPSPKFIRMSSFPSSAPGRQADQAFPVLGQPCTETRSVEEARTVEASSVKPCMDLIHQDAGRCTVVWRIDSVSSKLRTSRGFPLLSPCFTLAGLPDLRLMFAPGEEWLELASTAMSRRQKQRRTKMGSPEEQTFGMVKVKAGDSDACSGVSLRMKVFVGQMQRAAAPSTTCDFSKEVVQSCSLEADWRKHMDGSCLTIQMEFSW